MYNILCVPLSCTQYSNETTGRTFREIMGNDKKKTSKQPKSLEQYDDESEKINKEREIGRKKILEKLQSDEEQSSQPHPGRSAPPAVYQPTPPGQRAQPKPTPIPPPVEIQDDESTLHPILKEAFRNLGKTKEYGPKVLPELISSEMILVRGMDLDEKESLIDKYKIPENLTLLKAPTLNKEVRDIYKTSKNTVDARIQEQQNQLGIGLAAIAKALTGLVKFNKNDESYYNHIVVIINGFRILADLHYVLTKNRVTLIKNAVENKGENILTSVLKDTRRDETLFGSKLTEEIAIRKNLYNPGTPGPSHAHSSNRRPCPPQGAPRPERRASVDSRVATHPYMRGHDSPQRPSTSRYNQRQY